MFVFIYIYVCMYHIYMRKIVGNLLGTRNNIEYVHMTTLFFSKKKIRWACLLLMSLSNNMSMFEVVMSGPCPPSVHSNLKIVAVRFLSCIIGGVSPPCLWNYMVGWERNSSPKSMNKRSNECCGPKPMCFLFYPT